MDQRLLSKHYHDDELVADWNAAETLFNAADFDGALFLFRKIASRGVVLAYTQIGVCYENKGDYRRAEEYFRKTLRHLEDPEAHIGIGRVVARRDGNEAFRHLTRAAALLESELAQAEITAETKEWANNLVMDTNYCLGLMAERGDAAELSKSAAIKYYEIAAAAGQLPSKMRLGVLLVKRGSWVRGIRTCFSAFVEAVRVGGDDPNSPRLWR